MSEQEAPKTSETRTEALQEADRSSLTAAQRADIERKRQAALLLRQKRQEVLSTRELHHSPPKRACPTSRIKDTGGGFLVEELLGESSKAKPQPPPEPTVPADCTACRRQFIKSYLRTHFDYPVCNECRDKDKDLYDLITKTDAKKEYLLNDCDLDKRDPPLRCILKKNPHERARGDMKLFLRLQVEDRALEVWGSEENIEAELSRRNEKRADRQQKSYFKRIKQLRMQTRSSLFTRDFDIHEHSFAEPVLIDEDNDLYEKTCSTCGHVVQYEEL